MWAEQPGGPTRTQFWLRTLLLLTLGAQLLHYWWQLKKPWVDHMHPCAQTLQPDHCPHQRGRALPIRHGVHLVRRWWSVLWILCPVKGTSRQAWLGCLWYSSSNLLGQPLFWDLRPLPREGGRDAFWQWQSERNLKRGFNAWPSAEKTLKMHPSPPNSVHPTLKKIRKKKRKKSRGLPVGSGVKHPPANAGDMGLIPDLGRFHVLRHN